MIASSPTQRGIVRRKLRTSVAILVVFLASCLLGADACIDASWKEGIACGANDSCPDQMHCCGTTCARTCAPVDSGGADAATCNASTVHACFACVPGCPCDCLGAFQGICCPSPGSTTTGTCSLFCP